jgi:hypothetical protein
MELQRESVIKNKERNDIRKNKKRDMGTGFLAHHAEKS